MSVPEEDLDLTGPIRLALINAASIGPELATWENEPAVFTRRPVPGDGPYPMAVVSPPVAIGNADFLKARLPMPRFDVAFYGQQPDDYRLVEALAYRARALFHRQRFAVQIPGYSVLELVADGPVHAPTDDQMLVGRAVLLRFKLVELSTA